MGAFARVGVGLLLAALWIAPVSYLDALARVLGRPEEAARDYAQALAIGEAIGAVNLATTIRGNIEYLNQQHTRRGWWAFRRRA